MDYLSTFGHFHLVLLHLPIGLIAAVVVLEAVSLRSGVAPSRSAVRVLMWVFALSAVTTAAMGYVLSLEPGYVGATVSLHMWLGISVAAMSVVTLAAHEWALRASGVAGSSRRRLVATRVALVITLGLIVPAGHFGGTLTHGENFLFAGPGRLRPSTPAAPKDLSEFGQVVQPVLEANCYSCHSDRKQKGELALHTAEAILAGGRGGPVIEPGHADQSELVRRLRLPLEDEDHMPPKGKPQPTEDQIRAIEHWIEGGSSFTKMPASEAQAPEHAKVNAPETTTPVSAVPPANSAALDALRAALVHVQAAEPGSPLLWIDFAAPSGAGLATDSFAANLLTPVAANVQDLSLARSHVTDRTARLIASMPRLRRLDLSRTSLTDAGVVLLGPPRELAELNLVSTAITDESLEALSTAPKLKKLFVWSTKVTPGGIERLHAARPDLTIDTGAAPEGRVLEVEEPPKLVKSPPPSAAPGPAADLSPVNDKCPVTGDPVDPKFVIVYQGRCIGFCCSKCPAKFWEDPAKYANAVVERPR